jgi:chromosome segregation ATPase
MFLFNNKKKLKALNKQVQTKTAELDAAKERVGTVDKERSLVDEDVKRITELIENERRDQAQGQIEKSRLVKQASDDSKIIAQLAEEIAAAKEARETARARKERLITEVADAERLVHEMHEVAEASFTAARQRADHVQAEHERDRDRWVSMRVQQEDMMQQLDATVKQLEQVREQRDEVKRSCKTLRAELQNLRFSHQRLESDNAETEAALAREHATRVELEKVLADLDAKHDEIMSNYRELEETHGNRQNALKVVSDDLEGKQQALFYELRDFEARFEHAKAQRQYAQLEQGIGVDLSRMLPDLPRME